MTTVTMSELNARVIALEGAVAYTAAAYSSLNPEIKKAIVSVLKVDAAKHENPQIGKAIADLADLIESFKVNGK